VCHLDEAGFAMTLSTSYSWFPQGERLQVPYEASQGRRVHAIGAYFTHGPEAGRLEYHTWATLPKRRAKKQRKTPEEGAAVHGLRVDDVGVIPSERFLAFVWLAAGRPDEAPAAWKRVRPLMIVVDTYALHTSQTVAEACRQVQAADVHLAYLPAYRPELSAIEPVWNDVTQHQLPVRSFEQVGELKQAVDDAWARKAHQLQQAHTKTTNVRRLTT
jgi:hypothetical protein